MGIEAIIGLIGALVAAGTAVGSNVAADNRADKQKRYLQEQAEKNKKDRILQQRVERLRGRSSPLPGIMSQYENDIGNANQVESNANWANIIPALYGVGNSIYKGASAPTTPSTYSPTEAPPSPEAERGSTYAPTVSPGDAAAVKSASDFLKNYQASPSPQPRAAAATIQSPTVAQFGYQPKPIAPQTSGLASLFGSDQYGQEDYWNNTNPFNFRYRV